MCEPCLLSRAVSRKAMGLVCVSFPNVCVCPTCKAQSEALGDQSRTSSTLGVLVVIRYGRPGVVGQGGYLRLESLFRVY